MATRNLPDWETLYRDQPVETMPWFHAGLDPDLDRALKERKITRGAVLDLGTGPGTQAIALAERGFAVTAADLAQSAIDKAKVRIAGRKLNVAFVRDDILDTRLTGPFDVVFDRGCFHVLPEERRSDYVRTVAGLLRPGAILFLKCFSDEEPGIQGPYRFTPEMIRGLFSPSFDVLSIERTLYQGVREPKPHALFCTLTRRA